MEDILRFKFLPVAEGSGWFGARVAVDRYYKCEKRAGENILLTLDARNFEEYSTEIDLLIGELEQVREIARRKWKQAA